MFPKSQYPKTPYPDPVQVPIIKTSPVTKSTPDITQSSFPNSKIPGYFDRVLPSVSWDTIKGIARTRTHPVRTPPASTPTGLLPTPSSIDSTQPSLSRTVTADSIPNITSPLLFEQYPQIISPRSRSSGSAFMSSELSSGDYLTPPLRQDSASPPYKPRKKTSDSLTMKRPNSSDRGRGHTKTNHRRGRKRRRSSRHHRHSSSLGFDGLQSRACLRDSGCYMAPTASMETRRLCGGCVGRHLACQMINMRSLSFPFSGKPLIKRRWSSVELGNHRLDTADILHRATFADKPVTSRYSDTSSESYDFDDEPDDVLRMIKKTLTAHKLPMIRTPTTITLRRPSSPQLQATSNSNTESVRPQVEVSDVPGDFGPTFLITAHDVKSITLLIDAKLRREISKPKTPSTSEPRALNLTMDTSNEKRPSVTNRGLLPSIVAPANATVTTEGTSKIQGEWHHLDLGTDSSQAKRKLSSFPRSSNSVHEVIWEGKGSDDVQRSSGSSRQNLTPPDNKDDNSSHSTARLTPTLSVTVTSHITEAMPNTKSGSTMADYSIVKWAAAVHPQLGTPERSPRFPSSIFGNGDYFTPMSSNDLAVKDKNHSVDVVSFPPLQPRKLTSDWISPLPDINKPLPAPRTLYDTGLDATEAPPLTPHVSFKGTPTNTPLVRPAGGSKSDQGSIKDEQSLSVEDPSATQKMRSRSNSTSDQDIRERSIIYQHTAKGTPTEAPVWSSTLPGPLLPPNIGSKKDDRETRRKSIVLKHPNAPARVGTAMSAGSALGASGSMRRKSLVPHIRFKDNSVDAESKSKTSTWRKPINDSAYPTEKDITVDGDELPVGQEINSMIASGEIVMEQRGSTDSQVYDMETPAPVPGHPNAVPATAASIAVDQKTRTDSFNKALERRKQHAFDREKLIELKTPPLPGKMDNAGIYNKLNGAISTNSPGLLITMSCDRKACTGDDCAECKDLLDLHNPSVDWIG